MRIESSKTKYKEVLDGHYTGRYSTVGDNEKGGSDVDAQSISPKSPISRYKNWVKPFRGRVVMILVLGLVGVILGLIQPLVMKFLVDSVVMNDGFRGGEKLILSICTGLVAISLTLASSSLSLAETFETLNLNTRMLSFIRRDVFRKILNLSLSDLERMKSGEITNRLLYDTQTSTDLLRSSTIAPVILGVRVSVTMFLLFWVNWKLAIFATILVPPSLALSYLAIRKIQPLYSSLFWERGLLNGRLIELFRGIRVLKIYNREDREKMLFARDSHFVSRVELAAMKRQQILTLGWTFILSLAAVLIIFIGSVLSIYGYATIGDVFALALYTAFVLEPIFGLVHARTESKKAKAALEKVCEVLDPQDQESRFETGISMPDRITEIEFESLSFSYVPETPILKDISFSVKAGETVALVGRSGAGKSTLIDLLSRFYTADKGKILINKVDSELFNLRKYREQIAIVEQEVTLFEGTIAENIAYAKPWATKDEIETAARKADAHEFITSIANGYDSLVGENGSSLSGGQKQRISIARAFLANPKILILDEATSRLDAETEQSVQKALETLIKDRITFVIAHRLSTIRSADKIIVMHAGELVEMGSHAELIALRGRYYANVMYQSNFVNLEAESATV